MPLVSRGKKGKKRDWTDCVWVGFSSHCQLVVHHRRWIDLRSPCAFGGYGCMLCLLVLFRRRKCILFFPEKKKRREG